MGPIVETGGNVPEIFVLLAVPMAALSALLYVAPGRKLLNFVDYGAPDAVRRLNRYAAVRLLLPVAVNLVCAYIAALRPGLTVALVFLTPLSILCVVIWIGSHVQQSNRGIQ
jgi:hypothetical protein